MNKSEVKKIKDLLQDETVKNIEHPEYLRPRVLNLLKSKHQSKSKMRWQVILTPAVGFSFTVLIAFAFHLNWSKKVSSTADKSNQVQTQDNIQNYSKVEEGTTETSKNKIVLSVADLNKPLKFIDIRTQKTLTKSPPISEKSPTPKVPDTTEKSNHIDKQNGKPSSQLQSNQNLSLSNSSDLINSQLTINSYVNKTYQDSLVLLKNIGVLPQKDQTSISSVNIIENTFKINGIVYDPANSLLNLNQALVCLLGSQSICVQSGSLGIFSFFQVPPGDYQLNVKINGYQDYNKYITVNSNIDKLDIPLIPLTEDQPEINGQILTKTSNGDLPLEGERSIPTLSCVN